MPSHAVEQQNGSIAHTAAWHAASSQPTPPLATQQLLPPAKLEAEATRVVHAAIVLIQVHGLTRIFKSPCPATGPTGKMGSPGTRKRRPAGAVEPTAKITDVDAFPSGSSRIRASSVATIPHNRQNRRAFPDSGAVSHLGGPKRKPPGLTGREVRKVQAALSHLVRSHSSELRCTVPKRQAGFPSLPDPCFHSRSGLSRQRHPSHLRGCRGPLAQRCRPD